MEHGTLAPRDELQARYTDWASAAINRITAPEHREIIQRYITWHHKRRMRQTTTISHGMFSGPEEHTCRTHSISHSVNWPPPGAATPLLTARLGTLHELTKVTPIAIIAEALRLRHQDDRATRPRISYRIHSVRRQPARHGAGLIFGRRLLLLSHQRRVCQSTWRGREGCGRLLR